MLTSVSSLMAWMDRLAYAYSWFGRIYRPVAWWPSPMVGREDASMQGDDMARQERPVDPATGPLASFAYDLRKLRLEAGQPTYRVLAKAAGYSPSTLSEAANGVRRPSLDVVLAYVGACGGDATAWRARWLALDEELRPLSGVQDDQRAGESDDDDLPGEGDSTGPDLRGGETTASDDVPAGPPGASIGSDRRWWSRPKLGLVAAAGLTLSGVAVAQIVQQANKQQPTPVANPECPSVSDTATFTATTYGSGVHVRRGQPSTSRSCTRSRPVVWSG